MFLWPWKPKPSIWIHVYYTSVTPFCVFHPKVKNGCNIQIDIESARFYVSTDQSFEVWLLKWEEKRAQSMTWQLESWRLCANSTACLCVTNVRPTSPFQRRSITTIIRKGACGEWEVSLTSPHLEQGSFNYAGTYVMKWMKWNRVGVESRF